MRPISLGITLIAASVFGVSTLPGQGHDAARLTLGIGAGYIGSTDLWHVSNQPIAATTGAYGNDVFDLRRRAQADITLSGQFSYFRWSHVALTGDFTFMGLGPTDGCQIVQQGGVPELTAACSSLNGSHGSAATTSVNAGFMVRPFSHTAFQPYFKAMAGVAFTPTSTIRTESIYGQIADTLVALTIYNDDGWHSIRPTWTGAIGIATAPSSGYQLRLEARETWIGLGEVTGPTSGQGFVPPHRTAMKMVPSIIVAFDVVLERRHGRRY